jgi:C-terminal processing protease CtpA/Prc
MESSMNVKHLGTGLLVLALGLAGPAWAGPEEDKARAEMERARQEVEKARVELQKATRDLARSMAKVERDNPRVQYFEYMTNPDRAVLGVLIPDDVENGEKRGVRLLAVTPGSGADKAGLKAGDLLTSLNGESLAADGARSPQKRMKEQMRRLKAGDEVKVEYERDGKLTRATVKAGAPDPELALAPLPMLEEWFGEPGHAPAPPMPPMPPMAMYQFRGTAIRGLELAKLDEDLGSYFKTTEGVLVVKAPRNGDLMLKSGDVILKIDGHAVSEPVTVLDKLRSRGQPQDVKLEILRQGRKQELRGRIPVADARGAAPRVERRVKIVTGADDGG